MGRFTFAAAAVEGFLPRAAKTRAGLSGASGEVIPAEGLDFLPFVSRLVDASIKDVLPCL